MSARVLPPHSPAQKKSHLRLAIRSFISNTTWHISTAIGGKLSRLETTGKLPALSQRGTLQTRVGGGGVAPSRHKFYSHLGIRRYISNATLYTSNATWYISTMIGGKLKRTGPRETFPTLPYKVLGTCCLGGLAPRPKIPFASYFS